MQHLLRKLHKLNEAGTEEASIAIGIDRKVCLQLFDQYEGADRLVAMSPDGLTFDLYLTSDPQGLHEDIAYVFSTTLTRAVLSQAGKFNLLLLTHLVLSFFCALTMQSEIWPPFKACYGFFPWHKIGAV